MESTPHSSSDHRPELHLTAETGVLEAPAGAVIVDGALHVFHQFRPRPTIGSRWAHQYAPQLSYGWDVCDDVLAPEGNEIDILAGSSVPVGDGSVELFFVSTWQQAGSFNPDLQGNNVPHTEVGGRRFTIQRALIDDLANAVDCSDDPSTLDSHVTRLGPITIDDSAYPVDQLVTPSVIHDPTDEEHEWLMLALSLHGETDAEIVVLRSSDRQNWVVVGPLEIPDTAAIPDGRPFAPRIIRMKDSDTDEYAFVLFITYPGHTFPQQEQLNDSTVGTPTQSEVTGYIVGALSGNAFTPQGPFTVLDYGYDFTRPRIIQHNPPIMFGLVGAHPSEDDQWANCLSSPRNLTLSSGQLYQDIIGAPRAVKSFSNFGLLWTAQLDAKQGAVSIEVVDQEQRVTATVTYTDEWLSIQRPGEDARRAPLIDADSDSLTIFIDGPLCEVYADGGSTTLTSAIAVDAPLAGVRVHTTDGAQVLTSLSANGRELQRQLAGEEED